MKAVIGMLFIAVWYVRGIRREFFRGRNTSFGNRDWINEVQVIVVGWFWVR